MLANFARFFADVAKETPEVLDTMKAADFALNPTKKIITQINPWESHFVIPGND